MRAIKVAVVSVPHHLFVCTSCRQPGEAREPRDERSGAQLYRNLVGRSAAWSRREGFVITPFECLSVCTRPCGIAMRAPGKFTYVFGDLQPGGSESAIIECATMYRRTASGFMAREERPLAMRGGILARVPPLETP